MADTSKTVNSTAGGAAAGATVGGPWGALIGGGIGLAGGLLGGQASDQAAGEAHNQMIIAAQIIDELKNAPDISKPLILEKYKQAGILTPQMEDYIKTGPSEVSQIGEDSQLRNAQLAALQQMSQRSSQGLTASDRAALNQERANTQTDIEAKRQQILQQAQQRGQAGGGQELAAQLMASQSGANNESAASDRLAAMAQQNAMSAAASMGQLGSQVRQQDFGVNEAKAQAADQMNRFNVQNQLSQQQRNVAAGNAGQQFNLQNAQNVSNANVNQSNQEQYNQLQRQMQEVQYNQNLAQLKAGAHMGQIPLITQQGQTQAQGKQDLYGGLGQAVAGGIGAFSNQGSNSSQPNGFVAPKYGANENMLDNSLGSTADNQALNKQSNNYYSQGGEVKDYRNGGIVSGIAPYPGDNTKNDIVPAMLSPNELVVPRTIAKTPFGKHLKKLIDAHNNLKNHFNE